MNEITLNKLRWGYESRLKHWLLRKSLILIVLLGTFTSIAQDIGTIQIGQGTGTSGPGSLSIPVTNYDYSYSQQIVSSADFAAAGGIVGNITKLRYKPTSIGTLTVWNDFTVYIANTTKTSFESDTDWVPFTQLTQIYTGVLTPDPVSGEWFELTFSQPFNYTGDNIVIAVHENTTGWSGGPTFSAFTSTTNSGIVWREDGSNINPATDEVTATGRTATLPQIQFVAELASCFAPVNIQINPNAYGGTVTWDAISNGVGYTWMVVADNAGISGTPLVTGTTTNLTDVVTTLEPATAYDLYVKTDCGTTDGISGWSFKVDFITGCVPILIDFSQNFDSTATGSSSNQTVPQCWSFIDGGEGYGYVSAGTSISSPNRYYMYNNGDITNPYILVGPETDNLGNGTKQLRFFAYSSTEGTELIVGTMSNPTNAETFSPLTTIELATGYNEYVVSLPVGTNDYFAFKHGLTATYRSIYIDDVYYEVPPLCDGVLYGSLEATEITNVQALLGWESTGANFDVEYGEEGFEQGQGTLLSNVANNYLLQGLTQGSDYSYYVRSNCGEDGESVWRGPFDFTTQSVVSSPWFEGFSTTTIPSGWNQNTTSAYNFSATPYNFFINEPASDIVAYKNVYVPSDDLSGLTTINVGPILPGDILSFNYKASMYSTSSNEDDENGSVDPSSGNVEVLISTDFGITYVPLVTLEYGQVGWQTFEQSLANYEGQIIRVKLVTNWESLDIYVGFDNFYIGSCAMPTIPSVTATSMNSATISWTATATDVFEIEYGPSNFIPGSGTIVEVTGATYTILELEASTEYEYYIRRKCSATNNSAWAGKYKFITACDVFMTSFTENFDTTDTGSSSNQTVPICWTFHDGGDGYGYVTTGSEAPASPSKHFYIYNNSDMTNPYILISPQTDNLGNGAYQVRFKARGSSGAKLKFGRMSNKLDASTFVEIQEITLPTTYSSNDFVVYLPVTTDDYFAFKFAPSSTYQSLYIDDVVYEPIPACAPPIYLNANKNLVDLSANLSWQGPGNVTNNNFEIEWGETGFVQGSVDGTIVTSTTLSTTISNLVMGESYSYYVRRMCGTENTAWVGPYTFVMEYCTPASSNVEGTGMNDLVIDGNEFEFSFSAPNLHNTEYLDTNGITLTAGVNIPIEATYNTDEEFYYYNTRIWIDLNNDGIFSDSEIVFSEIPVVSSQEGFTHELPAGSTFIIPDGGSNITGVYRMRIIGRENNDPVDSCMSGSWFFSIDMNVNIIFPCIQPTNINFLDIGYEYVVLDWEGQGNDNFELEYGVTGFVPGTGTTVLNVTKPYTLEGLTPGTTYDFYVRKKCGIVYSDWSAIATTYVFCDTPEPTGENSQTLVSDDTLSQLVIDGVNLKFYADPGLTIELPATTALQSSGTFFVTQTINCESDSYLIVDVTVIQRIAMPIVASGQNFCDSGTIGDIPVASLPGATVIWFATETSTTPLAANTPLVTGDYFVVQTDGVTTSHRLLVPVVLNVTPPNLVSQVINLCGTYDFGDLTIEHLPDMTVKWYVSETAISPIPNNVPVETGTYYATQSSGLCESQRVAYQITQNDAMNKPIAGTQNFCGSGTVADLFAEGTAGAQILWFASATSVNVLSATTALSSGTYYVAQTMNGCTSERRAVAVRVISIAAPEIAPFTVCGGGTISDLFIPVSAETSYKWYLSPSSEFELEQTTALVQGTYFVERVQYGCVSARTAVQVTIGAIPNPPTGVAAQSFVEGSTIADLVLNQSNVVWYASFNDSQNGVNPLSLIMPLVNGTTYYAVIIGTNGCPSAPFAVTVDVYLSNDEFDKEGLKYYPNPVNDVLNIDYVESIRFVEVFDLLGKRVKTLNTNNQNVQIDLSDLASGTYMIQLKTDSKTQFIKVIKK